MGGPAGQMLPLSHLLPGVAEVAQNQGLHALDGEGMVGGDGPGQFHGLVHELV